MAAPDIRTNVRGLRQLEQNLIALAEQYGPNNAIGALRTPTRRTLRQVAEIIRRNTPVDTGTLRDSVNVRVNQATRRLRASRNIVNNAILVGRVGWFWTRPSLWNQALSVEFGNRTTDAQPVLRPALNDLASITIQTFVPEVTRSIETTAMRLGRRASAGTLRRR